MINHKRVTMKNVNKYWIGLMGVLIFSCDDGIDDITKVDPGPDETAPAVTINYPAEGTTIKVLEEVTSITMDFAVTDDIEIATVEVWLDGSRIGNFTSFTDYRRFLKDDLVYDSLTDGSHELTVTATDVEGKTTSSSVAFVKEPAYIPVYAGETLYMPFDGDYTELVSISPATKVGTPGFAGEGFSGTNAYAGAEDSYLTFPGQDLQSPEFTAVFWYKVNDSPDRAGILVMSPPDEVNPSDPNNRTAGFRFFRESAGGMQRFKLNVGTGDGESWFDGGEAADVAPGSDWTHMAFTISATQATVYINGEIVSQNTFPGISWNGCDLLSIMSGYPRFVEWDHWSDQSLMDELRLFNRALSQEEIQGIIATESGNASGYIPEFEGESLYMPFDGTNLEMFSNEEATVLGDAGFAGESVDGTDAYAGSADAYLTLPASAVTTDEFSASFWYKLNGTPDRAGILTLSPEDTENASYPDVQNNRTSGIRLFREDVGGNQVLKLNIGTGTDNWFDGGAAAALPPD